MLAMGDFRQILPVIPGPAANTLAHTLLRSVPAHRGMQVLPLHLNERLSGILRSTVQLERDAQVAADSADETEETREATAAAATAARGRLDAQAWFAPWLLTVGEGRAPYVLSP